MTETNEHEPRFVGEHVQIGTGTGGMKPLAQNGRVGVDNGMVRLFTSDGELIDEATIDQVELVDSKVTMGAGGWLTLGDRRYSVSVGSGGAMLFTGLLRIIKGRAGERKLAEAIEAERHTG